MLRIYVFKNAAFEHDFDYRYIEDAIEKVYLMNLFMRMSLING